MKRFLFWSFVLALAAVNWAALHDILKGEPNLWMEWAFVLASALLLLTHTLRKVRGRASGLSENSN